jgi:hypothetical protein
MTGAGDDHTKLVEDVFPAHADDLGREGCWKLVAGVYPMGPAKTEVLIAEAWVDSRTTAETLMATDAAAKFKASLSAMSTECDEVWGSVDEVVTMHISALRMG